MIKKILILIVPIISLLVAILTLKSYGINWDEPYHYRRGQAFLQYYVTGLKTYQNIPKYPPLKGDSDNPNFRNAEENFLAVQKETSLSDKNFRRSFYQDDSWNGVYSIDIENSYGHPAINDILASIFNKIFYQKLGILGDLESYKFFIIFTVSIATFFIAYFMFKEFGIIESVFTTLAFATYPLLFAEQHFNIKDPVETSFYVITILSAYWGIKKNSAKWLLMGAVFFGLALSTKFNIVFSLLPLSLWFIFCKKKLSKKIILALLITPIISLMILVASYPTLWKDPINGLIQIVKFYLEVGYPSSLPSGYYLFNFFNALPSVWIIITTPPVEILLFIVSIITASKLIKKNDFVFLLLVWFFVVVGRNSFFKALNYGGVRLIMEYIPALSMLTGITAGYLIHLKKNIMYVIISFGVLFMCFVPNLIKIASIHPNENEYFNFIIGGLGGAKQKNIPDWGNSDGNAYIGGVNWLNKNAEINARISTPIANTSNIPRIKLRSDIAVSPYYWSGLNHKGEYLIELIYDYPQMKWFALKYLNEAMTPVYEVKVDGIAIAKVWKNDPQFVKNKFKNTKTIAAKINSDNEKRTLTINLPTTENIMKVTILQPIKNCTQLHTGYVTSSSDGKNFIREEEDVAVDQLNRDEPKTLNTTYEYYFVATVAKTLIFNVDSSSTCLLNATSAQISYLKE